MKYCKDCKHWIGGGDWGLTCEKIYHFATTNGLTSAENCEYFEEFVTNTEEKREKDESRM